MSEEKLIWGAGFIDDDLVCEAIDYKPHRIRLAPWACAAAAAVVLVTAIAVFARQIGSSPVLPPGPSGNGYSDNASSSSSEFNPADGTYSSGAPAHSAVSNVPNGMELTGTPLDNSKLEEFSIERCFGGNNWTSEETFLDVLGIPELKDVFGRMECMQSLLNTTGIRRAPAVTENGREPAQIRTTTIDIYEESGYTYRSFYNAYLSAFTKEITEDIFNSFRFMDYNGALFCQDGGKGGLIGEVHREHYLLSKSDTVIEFRTVIYYDRYYELQREYDPDLIEEYDITYTDFKFVLTEDGWRAAKLPVEVPQNTDTATSTVPSTVDITQPSDPFISQKAYATVFKEFFPENPATYGPPLTCEEIMNMMKSNPDYPEYDIDSYYLVYVVEVLSKETYTLMRGESTSIVGDTLYEVKLVEDLISGEKLDRTAYVEISGGLDASIQLRGDPTYAPGEQFTAALSKPCKDWNDIFSSGYDLMMSIHGSELRYDLPQMSFTDDDEETMLYFRGRGQARTPIADLPFETEEINIEAAYGTPQNPATYIQKIALSDLVEFLRTEWEQAGISSHFENHTEN